MTKKVRMKNRTSECRIGSHLRVLYNYVCTLKKGTAFFYDNTKLGINDKIK